jgi:hypothetical protein
MSNLVTIALPPAREAQEWADVDPEGSSGVHPAEECGLCNEEIGDGDQVRKVGAAWMHETCAVAAITQAAGDTAWLLLADMITARPSAFRASDIKAVLSNVARIARRGAA